MFEAIMLLEHRSGATMASNLHLGRQLDVAVDSYFALLKFRRIAERGASSLKSFFEFMDLGDTKYVDETEMKHFLQNATAEDRSAVAAALAAEGVDVGKLAETFFWVLDLNKNGKVELHELRRQVALAAQPRSTMIEVMGHFQMKHGFGRCGFTVPMDRASLYAMIVGEELLEISPEVFSTIFRVANGSANKGSTVLSPGCLEQFFKTMQVPVNWGVEPHTGDHFYVALGARTLQMERRHKKDANLPPEALLDCSKGDGDFDMTELSKRFESLFEKYVNGNLVTLQGSLGLASPPAALVAQVKEACKKKIYRECQGSYRSKNLTFAVHEG
jgi:hypothetical protein